MNTEEDSTTTIDSTGLLDNEYPGEPSITYECRMFKHAIQKTIADDYVETISWELEGTIPSELEISNEGVIEGHIDILDYQPACQHLVSSQEPMKIDGSNWTAGRFQGDQFKFPMVVKWTFKYRVKPKPTPDSTTTKSSSTTENTQAQIKIKTLTANVYIDVYLDNDITNLVFCKRYLEAGESVVKDPVSGEDRIKKHYFNINGKDYTINEFQEFINNHPGPFPKCKI